MLLEKLIVSQLGTKYPAFFRTITPLPGPGIEKSSPHPHILFI